MTSPCSHTRKPSTLTAGTKRHHDAIFTAYSTSRYHLDFISQLEINLMSASLLHTLRCCKFIVHSFQKWSKKACADKLVSIGMAYGQCWPLASISLKLMANWVAGKFPLTHRWWAQTKLILEAFEYTSYKMCACACWSLGQSVHFLSFKTQNPDGSRH